ncbi:queuosine 5'-phosphate N-glycosylase/hydrolase [Prorops nasuta]|uniref:queuosine 5'-phosphate N-glycosylase/hydrolase n=1 Tax=Prorops nasuta TaxID=863751 RepID=UPI0034CE5EAF
MTLSPKESAKLIARLAKHVIIEEEGVKNAACSILEGLKDHSIHSGSFSQKDFHPKPDNPRAADWIFILDTLNFSFWVDEESRRWTVNGQSGYFGLCTAIKKAIDAGIPIIDPKYYSVIKKEEFEKIFLSDDGITKIPLINERVHNLHEAGQVLLKKYQGTFAECIKSCGRSAQKLLKLIVDEFESYRDEADYQGYRVSFYKRAQILVGDIWACFKEKGLGEFNDIESITMFADYRVPQVLVHFGAMRYNNPFMDKLNSNIELTNGSEEEVEIRGCSIEVVERIRDEVKDLIQRYPDLKLKESDVNSILIDHFLWDYRRRHAEELDSIPYHKTRTIYY